MQQRCILNCIYFSLYDIGYLYIFPHNTTRQIHVSNFLPKELFFFFFFFHPRTFCNSGTCVLMPRALAINWDKEREREDALLFIGNRYELPRLIVCLSTSQYNVSFESGQAFYSDFIDTSSGHTLCTMLRKFGDHNICEVKQKLVLLNEFKISVISW